MIICIDNKIIVDYSLLMHSRTKSKNNKQKMKTLCTIDTSDIELFDGYKKNI